MLAKPLRPIRAMPGAWLDNKYSTLQIILTSFCSGLASMLDRVKWLLDPIKCLNYARFIMQGKSAVLYKQGLGWYEDEMGWNEICPDGDGMECPYRRMEYFLS